MSTFISATTYDVAAKGVALANRVSRSAAARVKKASDILDRYQKCRFEFVTRPDDIFIVTYPRSGTTWLQMLLYQLTTNGELDFFHIAEKSPWFERAVRRGSDLKQFPSPRVFKSHLQYRFMPRGQCRYIYVVRDGRDVAVSNYHLHCDYNDFKGTFDEFMPRFFAGRMAYGSWFEHVKDWRENRAKLHVLYLRYEEMLADLPAAITRVAQFCALPLAPALLARTVERCQFSYMKEHADKFDFANQLALEEDDRERSFLRKGGTGNWSDYFSTDQLREFEQLRVRRHPRTCSF